MLELVLLAISSAVFLQLLLKRNSGKMWGWIVAYWLALTIRNAAEVMK